MDPRLFGFVINFKINLLILKASVVVLRRTSLYFVSKPIKMLEDDTHHRNTLHIYRFTIWRINKTGILTKETPRYSPNEIHIFAQERRQTN